MAVTGEVVLGPGDFDLVDPRSGLDDLMSYQQTLVVSFEGTREGQPHSWSKTYTFTHTSEPLVSALTTESSGDAVTEGPAVVAASSGVLYQSFPDGSCTGEPLDPESSASALQEPAAMLSGLLGAEEAGSEPANDVEALHYTFDERAMAESGRAETQGEAWVALDGGHLVKYTRVTTADATYFGEGVEGTITWAYDLTLTDQVGQISIPDGCQLDAPSMPDAVNLQVLPNWMGFDTPSASADVATFYQDQLPGRGWTPSGDPIVSEGSFITVYTKGDDTLNVLVFSNQNATRVDILVTTNSE